MLEIVEIAAVAVVVVVVAVAAVACQKLFLTSLPLSHCSHIARVSP